MDRRAGLAAALIIAMSGCLSSGAEDDSTHPIPDLLLWRAPAVLVVEIDFIAGQEPAEKAVQHLVDVLHRVTAKRDITLDIAPINDPPGAAGHPWTDQELRALRDRVFRGDPSWREGGARAYLHVLYVDGASASRNASGIAFGDFAVVFAPVTRTDVFVHPDPRVIESRETHTLTHEAGHLLGLVNNGVPMVRQHAKPGDPIHSTNPKSVMYADAEARLQAQSDLGVDQYPIDFDADDLADLAAERARDPHSI